MAFYIQYDPTTGNINATVNTDGAPPTGVSQIVVADGWVPTDGMRVNLQTLQLELVQD